MHVLVRLRLKEWADAVDIKCFDAEVVAGCLWIYENTMDCLAIPLDTIKYFKLEDL